MYFHVPLSSGTDKYSDKISLFLAAFYSLKKTTINQRIVHDISNCIVTVLKPFHVLVDKRSYFKTVTLLERDTLFRIMCLQVCHITQNNKR